MILPKAPPIASSFDFFQQFLGALRFTAAEDHDAPAVERRLDHIAGAIRKFFHANILLFVNFGGVRLFEVRGRRLHFDNVGAKLGRDLRAIGDHVNRGFPFFGNAFAPRIGPYHNH